MFHQKLRSNLLAGFLSQVLESVVFPPWVDLFLQREDSVGQPMGGHADSSQASLFQVVDFVGQSCNMGEFEWGGFFTPTSLELGDSVYKGREARFMVLVIKPDSMPSLERRLHIKIEEVGVRAGLKTHAPNNLSVSGTQLVLQEKIVFEQGEIRGIPRKVSQRWTKTVI
jgi:hypothetical protein